MIQSPEGKIDPHYPLEIVCEEEHYVVERILDSCLIHDQLHFLIKWDGYSYEENTWVPEHDISISSEL
jgi:hypothetical protein